MHDQVPHEELVALVCEHQGDLQALADAIVSAAREDEDGYRDDATVLVDRIPRQLSTGVKPRATR